MTHARTFLAWAFAALVLTVAGQAWGAGLLVPTDEKLPPLAIKYLRVDTTIDNQAATTRVVQEFQNSTKRDLECTYIFPLPKGAAIREFAMYIGGKRMKGELLESDKARHIYEEIVRRAKDPGLLEYMDGSLLRLRIFPVPANGTQKVEIEYTELLPADGGLAEYVFPLRVGDKASKTLDDFTVAVRIRSRAAIKSVYSPTHDVGVSRPNDHEAVAGMEKKAAVLDRDFHLFYTLSEKDFGLNLMTYRPDPAQPGMFLMLISPKSEINDDQRLPRDVALVLDTSGSMKGEKMEQARRALKFSVEKLDRKDRFAIVSFSTMAQSFAEGWTDAGDDARKKAAEWIDKMEAAGGTNISEALAKVFALPYDENRPATVLFLTDGRPTVDVTDTEALAQFVKEHNKRNLRIFTFGVGDDVSPKLLDRISGDTGGLTEYVREGEAIDGKVTRLSAKMSHPVMTELTLEAPGVKITETYPRQLPDLFRGSQVVVLGSYTGDGDSVIRLKGRVGKKKEECVYEGTFPKQTAERAFIAPLFANRKVGYLLDQVRLHGENKELRDEVVRLSLAYGIETPYTSYLVLENEAQYRQYGITTAQPVMVRSGGNVSGGTTSAGGGGGAWSGDGLSTGPATTTSPATPSRPDGRPAAAPAKTAEQARAKADRVADTYKRPASDSREPVAAVPAEPPINGQTYGTAGVRFEEKDLNSKDDSGKTAIDVAQAIQRLRQSENRSGEKPQARKVEQRGGRPFANFRGVWVDDRFLGTEALTKIKWGSEAYFRLLREKPALREILSLGQQVIVVTAPGQAVAVDPDEGIETLSDEQIKTLLPPPPAK